MTMSPFDELHADPVRWFARRLWIYVHVILWVLGAVAVAQTLFVILAQAKQFNRPTCGWWIPHAGAKPISLGPCQTVAGYVTVTLPNGTVVTVPGSVGGPGNSGGDKPGYGYGDSNHNHSGPPGRNK